MTILAGLVLFSAVWAIAGPRKYKTSRILCGIFSGLALLLLLGTFLVGG
jgi:hypothetical protein